MAREALLKVIQAEEEADKIVKYAKEEAKNMISSAERQSKTFIEDAVVKAKIECDKLKAKAEDEMKEELEFISQKSEERCRSIIDIPQDRFNEAKKILVERIVK